MTDMTIEKTFQRVGRWLRNDVPNCGWDCVKMIDLAEGRSLRSVMGVTFSPCGVAVPLTVCDRSAAKFLAE